MRKKICFIALLAIASCKPLPDVGDEVEYNIIDVDYNEHSYVVFDNFRGGLAVLHSPDCKCLTKE